MTLYLLLSLAGGALVAAPFLLLYSLRLPKAPKDRVTELLRRLSSGPIAHRGGQPENTLAAFERAKEKRASAVEVDLEVTKDGHGVLLHDASVDRTSNGTGMVRNLTLEHLKSLDFGSKWSEEFVGERIPTLNEAVSKCRELDLHIFLELKGYEVCLAHVHKGYNYHAPDNNYCHSKELLNFPLPVCSFTNLCFFFSLRSLLRW